MKKLVFNFKSKDTKKIKITANILGGKGANLVEMGRLGYPVPSGFTISTEVCDLLYKNNKKTNTFELIYESKISPLEVECKEFVTQLNESSKSFQYANLAKDVIQVIQKLK